MAATAALVFAVPHGPLAQPWPVFGGHLVSALIGVTCATLIGHSVVVAAAAVGLSIAAMQTLRATHPPAGGTALVAVIGGTAITRLGYTFVLWPVLINVVTIVAVGVLVNAPFSWRRYPASLTRRRQAPAADDAVDAPSHETILEALHSLESFVDISEQDLVRLHAMLLRPPGTPGVLSDVSPS